MNQVSNLQLTETAKASLIRDPTEFLEDYGRYMVYRVNFGSSFIGTTTIYSEVSSDATEISAMASFSVKKAMFEAEGSAAFASASEDISSTTNQKSTALTAGSFNEQPFDMSNQLAMGQYYNDWFAGIDGGQEMSLVYIPWWEINEVKSLVREHHPDMAAKFNPQPLLGDTTSALLEELTFTRDLIKSLTVARDNWACAKEGDNDDYLRSFQREMTAHSLTLQSQKEEDVQLIQTQMRNGDFSFFKAEDKILEFNTWASDPEIGCGIIPTPTSGQVYALVTNKLNYCGHQNHRAGKCGGMLAGMSAPTPSQKETIEKMLADASNVDNVWYSGTNEDGIILKDDGTYLIESNQCTSYAPKLPAIYILPDDYDEDPDCMETGINVAAVVPTDA